MHHNKLNFNKSLLLAPMEEVTDHAFRIMEKKLGADFVYTEFVNAEGLIRSSAKTYKKMLFLPEERPIGVQVYGSKIESVVEAAKLAESLNPDLIDINCGCWVKNVVGNGAGAALLKDIPYMIKLISEIVKAVKIPVTVKTRIGWDSKSIKIVEVSEMIENAGASAITIHCRTRAQGHKGEPEWLWINRVKERVNIPIILNGGLMTPEDVRKAFQITNCDGVMIARGAINNPWIFQQAKQLLNTGYYEKPITLKDRIEALIKHLKLSCEVKGEKRAVLEFRKHYSGYLKGIYNASKLRMEMMSFTESEKCIEHLYRFLELNEKLIEC